MKSKKFSSRLYRVITYILLVVLALAFLFPLYWIVTGAFKTGTDIYNVKPVMFPPQWTLGNFDRLLSSRYSHLFAIFGIDAGPMIPSAFLWLINTVVMSTVAMLLTCATASMAGYALAKQRFRGRGLIFGLIVCAMALPKQVILIPLLKEMAGLKLYNTLWAVILPTVGWPFGVFLMKQFSESVPGEMLEAARIDGASEFRTFGTVVLPLIKPGIGALAIFTFINAWNDYFMQLVMLTDNDVNTISLGIATLMGDTTVDMGVLMAGAALAAAPIIIVFLIFQKYFTQGITMGAVKG